VYGCSTVMLLLAGHDHALRVAESQWLIVPGDAFGQHKWVRLQPRVDDGTLIRVVRCDTAGRTYDLTIGCRSGRRRVVRIRRCKVSVTVVDLLSMSHDELDELFRASPAGPIPVGQGDGTAIFAPDTPVSDVAAKLAHLIAWKGKVFDPERGELWNEIGPTGAHAIRAKVY
jgi:hypothetical protein